MPDLAQLTSPCPRVDRDLVTHGIGSGQLQAGVALPVIRIPDHHLKVA